MLSQDDRRQLDAIEYHLTVADPVFAMGLGDGKPCRPCGDRRWPLWLGMVVAGLGFMAGVATQLDRVTVVAAIGWFVAVLAYRLQVRRSHGHRGWRAERGSR